MTRSTPHTPCTRSMLLQLEVLQSKFDAMIYHSYNLAQDLHQKEELILALQESETKARTLYHKKQAMTKSLLGVIDKERRVKFITGNHQITYKQVNPTDNTRDEMALAAARIREKEKKQEYAKLQKLSDMVDRLAQKYGDRYENISVVLTNTKAGSDPDGLPNCVPREFMGIWLFTTNTEPSKAEMMMYEDLLRL